VVEEHGLDGKIGRVERREQTVPKEINSALVAAGVRFLKRHAFTAVEQEHDGTGGGGGRWRFGHPDGASAEKDKDKENEAAKSREAESLGMGKAGAAVTPDGKGDGEGGWENGEPNERVLKLEGGAGHSGTEREW
jgi:hypothetical protein